MIAAQHTDLVPPEFRRAMGWVRADGHDPVVAHITPSRWSVGPPFFVGCCSCGWIGHSRMALAAAMHDTRKHVDATTGRGDIRVVDPDLGWKYDRSMAFRIVVTIGFVLMLLAMAGLLSAAMDDARRVDPEALHRGIVVGYVVTSLFGAGGLVTAILRRTWWSAPAARPPILSAAKRLGVTFIGIALYSLFPRQGEPSIATPFQVGWEATLLLFISAWMILTFIWIAYRNYRYGFRPIFFSRGTASGAPCATWLLHFSAEEAAGKPVTVARCDCGWSGRLRLDREHAKRDAERHAPHHSAPTHGIESRLQVRRSLMSRVERHRAKPWGFGPPTGHRRPA